MTATLCTGFSTAAKSIERAMASEAKRSDETVTFSRHSLTEQLLDVYQECSKPDWEGEGSKAVDEKTLQIAKQLVESLPDAFRTPVITGEPDGHINLEWYVHPRRILNVSVNPNETLHWSALIGAEDPRGSCPSYGQMPKTLQYWIGRVCGG